jgi:hypothetical protein
MKDYEFLPLVELRPGREAVRDWPDNVDWDGGKGLTPGRWLKLGDLDHGPPFLWDEGKDNIALTDFDAPYDEVTFLGTTLARFLESLFNPSSDEEDAERLESRVWLQTLQELDKFV